MRSKVFVCITVLVFSILIISIPIPSLAEQSKTIDQEIANLETKLQTVPQNEKIDVLNKLSIICRSKSPQKSMQYANRALELSRELTILNGEAMALKNLSRGHIMLGDSKKALEFAEQSVTIAERSGDKRTISECFNNIGIVHAILGNYDQTLAFFQKALKIRRETGDKKGIADTLNDIGNIYMFRADYDTGLEYHLEALERRKEMGEKEGIAVSLSNIGAIYKDLGKYEKSLEYYLEALNIGEEIGDDKRVSSFLNNIGAIYADLENYDEALKYFLESLKIKEKIGDKKDIANSMGNVGKLYLELGNYRKTLDYLRKSLTTREEMGDKRGIADDSNWIGVVYMRLGQYETALVNFRKSMKITVEIGDKSGLINTLSNMGKAYTKLKNYDAALKSFERCLEAAKDEKKKENIEALYNNLSEFYAAKGDYKNALRYHKLYADLKDTLYKENSSKQMAEMQARYDSLKKEKEIEILTKNNELLHKNSEIQKLSLSRERLAKYAFILSFVLVSIILALLFRKYLYLFAFWKTHKYIGRFRLMEEIGTGGMGTVYKAHNIKDKIDTAAVKVLKQELFKNESNRKRFKQEATIIDKLDHPNIIKIFERGEYKERLFIAMELLDGRTLDEKIAEQGQMNLKECLHIMLQIADALVLIHGKDIVHRDIKPSNIMLIEKDGDRDFVKLLDFGLAKMKYQTKLTGTGMFIGTIDYMAPEQFSGTDYSTASDVYSLGVTYYQVITGKMVFPGETANDIIRQVLEKTPLEPNLYRPDIPVEINGLILRMLEKDMASRPGIKDVFETLQTIKSNI